MEAIATLDFWLLFVVVLGAFAVKSLTGFGNSLIVGGAFSFVRENRFTTPVELLWNLPTNFWMAWRERAHLDYRLVLPTAAFVATGDLLGAWLLGVGDDAVLRSLLGLLLVGLAIEMLFNRRTYQPHAGVQAGIGLASGVMMGLFGIGALMAAWFNKLSDRKEYYRSNLCFVAFVDNVVRTGVYGATGLFTSEALLFSLLLFPAVGLGLAAGSWLDHRVSAAAVRRLVVFLLLISGVLLVVRFQFGLRWG